MELGIGSRVRNDELGVGIVTQTTNEVLVITFVNYGVMEISHTEAEDTLEIIENVPPRTDQVSLDQVEKIISRLVSPLTGDAGTTELGGKWDQGTLILKPGNPDLKPYEMSIDTFFHKIVMVRDRLRVMEQRINSSSMTDEEKVNLQQYITKIYGSLTSFNILFDQKEQGFSGNREN